MLQNVMHFTLINKRSIDLWHIKYNFWALQALQHFEILLCFSFTISFWHIALWTDQFCKARQTCSSISSLWFLKWIFIYFVLHCHSFIGLWISAMWKLNWPVEIYTVDWKSRVYFNIIVWNMNVYLMKPHLKLTLNGNIPITVAGSCL